MPREFLTVIALYSRRCRQAGHKRKSRKVSAPLAVQCRPRWTCRLCQCRVVGACEIVKKLVLHMAKRSVVALGAQVLAKRRPVLHTIALRQCCARRGRGGETSRSEREFLRLGWCALCIRRAWCTEVAVVFFFGVSGMKLSRWAESGHVL